MDKLVFRKFAKLVGNEEDLVPLANEYDEEYPDNWDEMSEDMKDEWKKAHMMKANADDKPEVKTAPVQNQRPAPVIPQKIEIPAEIMQLNALVKEIGGTEALRTLLLSAATVTANALAREETEKCELVSVIKANSAEFNDEKELEALPVSVLRKMAAALPGVMVDFEPLAPRLNASDAKDKIAPRPSILFANTQK